MARHVDEVPPYPIMQAVVPLLTTPFRCHSATKCIGPIGL
jgi:hypothetical protein